MKRGSLADGETWLAAILPRSAALVKAGSKKIRVRSAGFSPYPAKTRPEGRTTNARGSVGDLRARAFVGGAGALPGPAALARAVVAAQVEEEEPTHEVEHLDEPRVGYQAHVTYVEVLGS